MLWRARNLNRNCISIKHYLHTPGKVCLVPPSPCFVLHWRRTLTGTLRHLTGLLSDHQRWRALADNARYYRDHPEVARRVADCSG